MDGPTVAPHPPSRWRKWWPNSDLSAKLAIGLPKLRRIRYSNYFAWPRQVRIHREGCWKKRQWSRHVWCCDHLLFWAWFLSPRFALPPPRSLLCSYISSDPHPYCILQTFSGTCRFHVCCEVAPPPVVDQFFRSTSPVQLWLRSMFVSLPVPIIIFSFLWNIYSLQQYVEEKTSMLLPFFDPFCSGRDFIGAVFVVELWHGT